ncbi:MAG: putative Ig domain-containing protein, partial [Gammaproteobacteria bacterium]|nr:putative Ig domain-containing protein [Gammaproteobacteria bacterium]
PSFDQSGSYDNIEIFVTDGTASTPLDAFDILVSNTNRAPHIDGVPYTSVTEGFSYAFTPTASDPDGDPLTFTIQNQPAWADFNTSSGSLTGTPTLEDAGAYDNIIINVSDGLVTTALNSFSIRVKDANQPPMITGTPTTQVAEDHNYAFMPIASDPDGDRLLFKISNQPPWSYFDTTTGILSGTPGFDDAGDYNDIQISVSDGMIEVSLNAFSILVSETNQAPLIEGIPSSSTAEGEAYDFKPSANDPDGDTLRFTILNKPAWAAFSTSTGSLSGIPDFSDAGSYESIRISVSDGHSTTSLETFSITVNNTNQPPTISGNPSSDVAENDTYYFIPDASDPDGENLTFEIENRPSWASFDQSSGSLSGTPDFASAGDYNNIKISVFDGSDRVYLAPFGITVTDTNRPPVISGTPASSVVIGDSYSFIPNATDPDDDSLSFNITNLPSWASFDRASGAITGSPEVDDFGLYEDITLSVSDSLNEASLSLTIMVEEPSVTTGSAKLTWNIPTTRTDGTALDSSDIGGYRIYMGMDELKLDEQNMVMVKDTEDGLVTEYEAMNLPSGTYFFKVKAYDKAGNESQLSNYAMKEI